MLVDTHCHLDDARFDADRDAVLERARAAGVDCMMAIGTGHGPPDLEAAIRLADRYACVYATAGVHPHDAAKATDDTIPRLEDLLGHPKVLALGEIGLDYHYNNSPSERQREVFAAQLQLAARAGVPVVIHTREAWEDTFAIIERHWNPRAGGIMHCFSGGPGEAERCIALGFHLSFAGIVTYPKAADVREAARLTPLDRLLVETDAPYLAPVPHRGKRNEPAFVAQTARQIAELRAEPFERVAAQTSINWRRLCSPPEGGTRGNSAL
jgi:TatD DNase family protein